MSDTKIYIICTYNNGGRYVKTATTNRERADVEAARVVEGYAADGWTVRQTEQIPAGEWGEGPGDPSVIEVFHLRNAAGDWCNVELYEIDETNSN